MTDARLRSRHRAAQQEGPLARAALLRERIRAGEACSQCCGTGRWKVDPCSGPEVTCSSCAGLSLQQRVELAAYCGDEVSRLVVGVIYPCKLCSGSGWCWLASTAGNAYRMQAGPRPALHHEKWSEPIRVACQCFKDWLSGLSRWGRPVLVRAACAAARVALHVWEGTRGAARPDAGGWAADMAPRRAIEAAEAWLACPCEEHLAVWAPFRSLGAYPDLPEWVPRSFDTRSDRAQNPLARVQSAARLTGEQPVREAIQRALVEWALGDWPE